MLVVSIVLEAAVAVIAVLAARKGKPYVYGLAFTFGIYVLYDLARLLRWDVEGRGPVGAVPARHDQRADRGVGTLPEIARRSWASPQALPCARAFETVVASTRRQTKRF